MLRISSETLEVLRTLCNSFGVRELSLFGSGLRDDFSAQSDVDLLVDFDPQRKVSYFDIFRLQRELEQLFGRPVDLVPKRGLRQPMAEEILRTSTKLYAS